MTATHPNRLEELMTRVNTLQDFYETALAEDDHWTVRECLLELDEINEELDKLDKEP